MALRRGASGQHAQPLEEANVRREMAALVASPITADERVQAHRSLVRFERQEQRDDGGEQIRASEDWVRLYVALRRAGGGNDGVRIHATQLRGWSTRVHRSTTMKRKCFVVQKALLQECAEYPPDLDQ